MERKEKLWLTEKVAYDYYNKAKKLPNPEIDIGERRALREELQNKYDICEIEAINIINGHHIKDYVARYEKMRQKPKDDDM